MDAAVAEIGHNQPEASDEFLALEERLEALTEVGNKWINERPVFTDDDMAGKASDFIDQLKAFNKAAETLRKAEKEPYLERGRQIDAQFKGLVSKLDGIMSTMKDRLTAFLREQNRIKREAEEKARKEEEERRRVAEAAAREAEEARKAAEAGENVGTDTDVVGLQNKAKELSAQAEQAAEAASEIAQSKTQAHGNYGNAKGLRAVWSAKITDYDAALIAFKDNPEIKAAVEKIANGLARSPASRGMTYPGIEFVKEEKV